MQLHLYRNLTSSVDAGAALNGDGDEQGFPGCPPYNPGSDCDSNRHCMDVTTDLGTFEGRCHDGRCKLECDVNNVPCPFANEGFGEDGDVFEHHWCNHNDDCAMDGHEGFCHPNEVCMYSSIVLSNFSLDTSKRSIVTETIFCDFASGSPLQHRCIAAIPIGESGCADDHYCSATQPDDVDIIGLNRVRCYNDVCRVRCQPTGGGNTRCDVPEHLGPMYYCTSDSHCSGGACDLSTNQCTRCTDSADCSNGYCQNPGPTTGECRTRRNVGETCPASLSGSDPCSNTNNNQVHCIASMCRRICENNNDGRCGSNEWNWCNNNNQCSGSYCQNPGADNARCMTRRDQGQSCSADHECQNTGNNAVNCIGGICKKVCGSSNAAQCSVSANTGNRAHW
eukprot:SAG31_NODE_2345_length_5903_cov_1.552895_6_plen_394_part_00